MSAWVSLATEAKANTCQRIWHRLHSSGSTSAVGLMHEMRLTLDIVGGALTEMEKRGAVTRETNGFDVEIWTAVKRSAVKQ